MDIEIKHLAPYLPYKLRIMHGENNKVMNTGRGSSKHWIGIASVVRWQNIKAGCKPVMNPLSSKIITDIFTKRGLKVLFVDISPIYCRVKWEAMGEEFNSWVKSSGSFDGCQTWIMNELYENHVDVFDLISNGLAIQNQDN